jgi:Spy/CpxP family protein refolding chaperone
MRILHRAKVPISHVARRARRLSVTLRVARRLLGGSAMDANLEAEMRYAIVVLSLVGALGACATPTVQAEPAKPAPAAKSAQPTPPPPLSADQQTRIAQLRIDMQTKVAPLRAQAQIKRLELSKLWMAPQPKRDDIVRVQNEMNDVHRKIQEARVDFRLAILAVLTPEQRAASGPGMCQQWAAGSGVCAILHDGPGMGAGHKMGPGQRSGRGGGWGGQGPAGRGRF